MKKTFLTALLAVFCLFGAYAQVQLEDFEGGTADLPWTGLNGTYDGVVANPSATGLNTSAGVGKYTNLPAFDYNFAIAERTTPYDLSEYNLAKMKVWSPIAPTKVLFKFEGGGKAVEKIVDITVANQWVEYSFDVSAGSGYTSLTKLLVSFNPGVAGDNSTYYFDDIRLEKNQQCYADFEGPGLNFEGVNGTFTAPEPNPGPNSVNSSPNVAKYIKSGTAAYSLLQAVQGTAFDLSVYNQFKIHIYATAATQVLMKLEGPGVPAIEKTKNIAVTNAWQEYTFDFSAQAANTGLTKLILFFDPGVEASADTYYFDNICAVPQGSCAGVAADPDIIDDFECNRNATYAAGWDSLSVVNNPFPTGDNNSAKVGKYNDVAGTGTEYSALIIDYQTPIDFTEKNQFSVQVYSTKSGTLLLKTEGGVSKEYPFPINETNKWVTYTADFTAQAGAGNTKFVIFFNAGVNGDPGDVYYIDNIKLSAPTSTVLEDFQGAVHLAWQPLEQNEVVHGVFTGPTNNAAPNSVNNSSQVGCYTKGTSAFSTLQAISPVNYLDLTPYAQFNVDVLSPASGGTVTMQLNSLVQGNKEATATITTPGEWETLHFDFSAYDAITDFGEIRLIFNSGTAAAGQGWCVDNLTQSKVTIDACAGTVPVPNIINDFECQHNFASIFYGEANIKTVNNPHLTTANGSLKVGEYTDPAGAYEGLGFEFASAPDLTLYNHLKFQVWSPTANVPFLIKLQGPSNVEIFDTITTANAWETFDIDFSGAVGTADKQIIIFFNVGNEAGGGTYYIDNIQWARAGYNGCVANNEDPALIDDWFYFANGPLESTYLNIVDNPAPGGINTSPKVAEFVKSATALPFAGAYTNPNLESAIDFRGVKTIRAKVYMNHIGNFAAKLENSGNGSPSLEIPVANTKINEWEEITVNFAAAPDNGDYHRLTLFFDLGIDATGSDVTSYFDDIVIGDGSCTSSGTFHPGPVATMSVFPNPANSMLMVKNFEDVARIEVFNAYGQRIASVQTLNELQTDINVSQFPVGMYSLAGFGKQGSLLGLAKFVKQ